MVGFSWSFDTFKDNKKKFSLIEIHNRPSYILHIEKNLPNQKYILVIHNNPQTLRGAVTAKERKHLIKLCSKITFVSNWVKEKFFEGLDIKNHEKTQVLYPAINKISKMPKKEKIISACLVGSEMCIRDRYW